MQAALRRRAAHNGLELSRPAARATVYSFGHNLAGRTLSNFPHASRVRSSEWLGIAVSRMLGCTLAPCIPN
jgi:hypothetical protein